LYSGGDSARAKARREEIGVAIECHLYWGVTGISGIERVDGSLSWRQVLE
jgi:hypothetical protein